MCGLKEWGDCAILERRSVGSFGRRSENQNPAAGENSRVSAGQAKVQ